MRKTLIIFGIFIITVAALVFYNKHHSPKISHALDYSRGKVKKSKGKKLGKSKNGFFKHKNKEDKLYSIFKKTLKDKKPKMLLMISEKNGSEKGGKIIIHDQDAKISKPGIIFQDKTDVKTFLKQNDMQDAERIDMSPQTDDGIIQTRFK